MKKFLALSLFCTLLSACTPTTATRGNYLIDEDVNSLQAGLSTQNDVLNLLGTPTSSAVFEKVTDRKVYKIAFDDTGVVSMIKRVDGETLDVPLASRTTPTSGNEITFIQQVLGNVGKYNQK
jgi:outer membrane protein assembly factor BamE (lipoprotein component of BamABCDE complex)